MGFFLFVVLSFRVVFAGFFIFIFLPASPRHSFTLFLVFLVLFSLFSCRGLVSSSCLLCAGGLFHCCMLCCCAWFRLSIGFALRSFLVAPFPVALSCSQKARACLLSSLFIWRCLPTCPRVICALRTARIQASALQVGAAPHPGSCYVFALGRARAYDVEACAGVALTLARGLGRGVGLDARGRLGLKSRRVFLALFLYFARLPFYLFCPGLALGEALGALGFFLSPANAPRSPFPALRFCLLCVGVAPRSCCIF